MKKLAPLTVAGTHLRLRADGTAEQLPVSPEFWPDLIAGKFGGFRNEYLISCHAFTDSWTSWEQHPHGDEIVIMLSGAMDFVLEQAGGNAIVELRKPGDFAFVPKGTWHTADAIASSTLLFITAGEGTQGRPRE